MVPVEAEYLGRGIVRSVRHFARGRKVYPAFFADPDHTATYLDPVREGPEIAKSIRANGVLIDTFDKAAGQGLLDYIDHNAITKFACRCHSLKPEALIRAL